MKLIDGKKISSAILFNLKDKIAKFPRKIALAVLVIGNNPSSEAYIRMKKKACLDLGIDSIVEQLSTNISFDELGKRIEKLNQNRSIDGILMQLPIPEQLNPRAVCSLINPTKDVDGFHPINMGKLLLGEPGGFVPCTPLGIHVLLEHSNIDVSGKHVVIVGRSNIVGKPLAALLMQKRKGCNATVTIAHSQSENLEAITKTADILVAAMGRPHFIQGRMIKKGAIVIDVGVNRMQIDVSKTKLVGDVDFLSVSPIASQITPVPGGVGPMTIAMLMQNTYESAANTL